MTILLSLLFAGSMTLEFRPAVSLDTRAAVLDSLADDMRAQASIIRMPMEGAPR